jgi:hypothetical protein
MPGADMAITNKSAIPLNAHDLRVVEGERCFLDRRLNLRLGYGRGTEVRDLIRRNKEDFEKRFGTLRQGAAKSQGGRPAQDYWLTKGQALWVCRKSDADNADDVMEEVIKVFLAVDAGIPIPNTPWTDALLAPEAPTIQRGDGNVVHVKHEEPLGDLFDAPSDDAAKVKPPAHPNAHNAYKRDVWIEEEDGISYVVTKERNAEGNVCLFDYLRNPPIHTSTETLRLMPWINGSTVRMHLNHIIPMAILERTYLNQLPDSSEKDIAIKTTARNTLKWFQAI